jgi:hypothetical protein
MLLLLCILLFFINIVPANSDTSNKRGLVYLYADPSSSDVDWDSEQSDLTWYYNYGSTPSDNIDGKKLQFVPVSALFGHSTGRHVDLPQMLWGHGSEYLGFYESVTDLLKSTNNINYVLGFNEPDL